jgi:uncharacterized repeat protein (TIGR01451 family)
VTVTNNSGALSVAGLPFADDETADLSFTGWTCAATAGSSCAAPTGVGAINTAITLAPLGVATLTINALADPDSMAATVTNTAIVNPAAAGVFDPVSGNNQASDTNSLTRSADVRVTKSVAPLSPVVGGTVTFTVTALNNGPSTARDVEVTDALPTGYTLISATPATGTFTDPEWTIGDLAPGATPALVISATVNASGNYTNVATITTSTSDPLGSNNSATVSPNTVGLRVEKTSSIILDGVSGANPKSLPGAVVEYRITVFNEGSSTVDLDSVVVEDLMPSTVAAFVTGAAVTFVDGANPSGLNFTYASDVSWSSAAGGGPPYNYTPVPDGAGYDSAVTGIRINPKGTMAAGSVGAPTSFTIIVRARVE